MYRIAEPVSGSICTPEGDVDFDLKAGEHQPKDDRDHAVMAWLVSIGAAEPVTTRPRRSTKED